MLFRFRFSCNQCNQTKQDSPPPFLTSANYPCIEKQPGSLVSTAFGGLRAVVTWPQAWSNTGAYEVVRPRVAGLRLRIGRKLADRFLNNGEVSEFSLRRCKTVSISSFIN